MYKFDLDLKLKIDLFLKVSSFKIKNVINFKYFYLIKLCIPVPNINLKKISLIWNRTIVYRKYLKTFFIYLNILKCLRNKNLNLYILLQIYKNNYKTRWLAKFNNLLIIFKTNKNLISFV